MSEPYFCSSLDSVSFCVFVKSFFSHLVNSGIIPFPCWCTCFVPFFPARMNQTWTKPSGWQWLRRLRIFRDILYVFFSSHFQTVSFTAKQNVRGNEQCQDCVVSLLCSSLLASLHCCLKVMATWSAIGHMQMNSCFSIWMESLGSQSAVHKDERGKLERTRTSQKQRNKLTSAKSSQTKFKYKWISVK